MNLGSTNCAMRGDERRAHKSRNFIFLDKKKVFFIAPIYGNESELTSIIKMGKLF